MKKPRNETTSTRVAKIAARGLKDPSRLTKKEVQSLAATALTQVPDKDEKE